MFVKNIIKLLTILSLSLAQAAHHHITDVICSGNAAILIDGKADMIPIKNTKNVIFEEGVMIVSGGQIHANLPKKLHSLSLHDNCQLKTKHWNGHIKDFVHNSKNNAIMDGFISINSLLKTGNGRLIIFWLDGNQDLVATIKTGKAYLAGQVKRLILRTTGNSDFNGQHLISRRVLLKSSDQSTAHVHPVEALTVFSLDQSHVGYVRPVSYSNLSSSGASSIVLEPFRQS